MFALAVIVLAAGCSESEQPPVRSTTTMATSKPTTTQVVSTLCEAGTGYHAFLTGLRPNPSAEDLRTRLLQSATWLGTLSTVTDEPLAGRLRVSARIRGELAAAAASASSPAEIDALVAQLSPVELAAYQQPPAEVEALLETECDLEFD